MNSHILTVCSRILPRIRQPTPQFTPVLNSHKSENSRAPNRQKPQKEMDCQVQDACLRCVSWCTAMSHPPGCMSALSPWRRKKNGTRFACNETHSKRAQVQVPLFWAIQPYPYHGRSDRNSLCGSLMFQRIYMGMSQNRSTPQPMVSYDDNPY